MKVLTFVVNDDEAEAVRKAWEDDGDEVYIVMNDGMGNDILEIQTMLHSIEEIY